MGQEERHMQLYRHPEGEAGSPKVNPSVQEGRAPKQHPQHGVEGAPHRAEAFVAMQRSEERSQTVTTHDNRAVANTTSYPEAEH